MGEFISIPGAPPVCQKKSSLKSLNSDQMK